MEFLLVLAVSKAGEICFSYMVQLDRGVNPLKPVFVIFRQDNYSAVVLHINAGVSGK